MAIIDDKHFTFTHLLPYQRNFILVNSVRSVGKTYGTYAWLIDNWHKTGEEFIAICRTQDEKKDGFIEKGTAKVFAQEFPEDEPKFKQGKIIIDDCVCAHTIALSEAVKIKKQAYPNVKYMFFDEYCLEEKSTVRYVNGWDEPDLLLNIYHTVDREQDKVICILMANNISAYNPYHMHKAFRIPYTPVGKVWKSENVVFENAAISPKLAEEKADCKFLRMISDTTYGDYAKDGKYAYDNMDLVQEPEKEKCRYWATLYYNSKRYGIWSGKFDSLLYISNSINPTAPDAFGVRPSDVTDRNRLWSRKYAKCLYFSNIFRAGFVRFETMELKKRFTEIIPYLI